MWTNSDDGNRYQCTELEDAYGCDCSDCDCDYDFVSTPEVTTTQSGCTGDCLGGIDCDELSEYYFEEFGQVYSCSDIEELVTGCDCSGCHCPTIVTTSTPSPQCSSDCLGFSCTDWNDSVFGGIFSCSIMENTYGCDCSFCECEEIHGECLEANNLCEIGGLEKTCDEWDELGGDTLTCQYLEFYFACDCTNCRCAGDAVCV